MHVQYLLPRWSAGFVFDNSVVIQWLLKDGRANPTHDVFTGRTRLVETVPR